MKLSVKSLTMTAIVAAAMMESNDSFAEAHRRTSMLDVMGRTNAYRRRQHRHHPSPFADLLADFWTMPVYEHSQESEQHHQHMQRHHHTTQYDLFEDKDGYRLTLEVPGVAAEDLNVSVSEDRTLRVTGSRKYRNPSTKKIVNEARLDQTFQLSSKCNIEAIEVALLDGILTITAPKKVPEVRKLTVSTERKELVDEIEAEEENDGAGSVAEVTEDGELTITEDTDEVEEK